MGELHLVSRLCLHHLGQRCAQKHSSCTAPRLYNLIACYVIVLMVATSLDVLPEVESVWLLSGSKHLYTYLTNTGGPKVCKLQ